MYIYIYHGGDYVFTPRPSPYCILPRPTSIFDILEDVCIDKAMELSCVLSWITLMQQQCSFVHAASTTFNLASASIVFHQFVEHFHSSDSVTAFCVYPRSSFCCLNVRHCLHSHDEINCDETITFPADDEACPAF